MGYSHLLPVIIDERARKRPLAAFAKIPRDNAYENGYRTVTNSALATAIDYVANLITSTFAPRHGNECIAYLGLSDLRYTIVLLGSIKAGFTTFLPSPRNSEEAQVSLMTGLGCTKLITTSPQQTGVSVLRKLVTQTLEIPSLDFLIDLDPSQVTSTPYRRTPEETKADPIFILHTSGSTGIPKPLFYTHEFVARVYNTQTLVPPDGYRSIDSELRKGTSLVTLPPFHIAGLVFTLIFPALYESIPVYPIAGALPTLDVFLGAVTSTTLDWAFLSPVAIDEIGRDPVALETVSQKLKYLFFSGGSVPKDSGTAIAAKLELYQVLGSSECAAFPLLRATGDWKTEDWHYVRIHSDANVEFRQRFEDCYELVQVRRQDRDTDGAGERYQPVFCHFGGSDSYATKDLFAKHPTLPHFFTHVGRIDDIVVFLNGEKTNPITFQNEVAKHPEVRAALLIGEQREEAALLVEPTTGVELQAQGKRDLMERIWPVIEESNTRCPQHARVSKDRVLVTSADMPFLRAGKGTVQRQSTLALYEDTINALYENRLPEDEIKLGRSPVGKLPIDKVTDVVRQIARELNGGVLSDTTNFLSVGMDSVQVIRFQRALERRLPEVLVTTRMIYSNPTIEAVAKLFTRASTQSSTAPSPDDDVSMMVQSYQAEVDNILDERGVMPKVSMSDDMDSDLELDSTRGISGIGCRAAEQPSPGTTVLQPKTAVLLTGSTGALGSYILNALLEDGSRVYCFNRSADSQTLQIMRNKNRGLPAEFPDPRVTFLTGNLALPYFGLPSPDFEDLQRSVTHVIHNAWPVDFNKPLPSFVESLDGVINLVRFSHHSQHDVALQFISSITSVARYSEAAIIPEHAVANPRISAPMGYGESKYVAEMILAYSSRVLGVQTISARVGQISGDASRKRGWSLHEWFPSLVVSSLHMRALPSSLGRVENDEGIRWIPIDTAAKILLEIHDNGRAQGSNNTFHVLHPEPTPWSHLLPTVKKVLNRAAAERGRSPIQVISYHEWVSRLEARFGVGTISAETLAANPAMKLLPFFKSLLFEEGDIGTFELSRTVAASSTLRKLRPMDMDCLEAWIEDWLSEADLFFLFSFE
jgi:thioester reductase-like protein/acyl-coenzyme A synthetase/AMP-(fatty) acid ligase/aryl carrier-like protein